MGYDSEVIEVIKDDNHIGLKRLYNLVDEVQESHVPVQIMGKRSSAVLVSEEDWRAIEGTLFLASIPGIR